MMTETYEYTSAWTERLKAEGKSKLLLLLLESQGRTLTDETRNRILTCTDPDQIDIWFARTLSNAPLDQIFDA